MEKYNIIAKNKNHLKSLIHQEVEMYGNACVLNHIDVSNVNDISDLFKNSEFNGDISKWNVSNVKNMSGLFSKSKFNGDISNWDVSNVEDMSFMFNSSIFNGNLEKWKTSKVRLMWGMFAHSKFDGDISNWNTSNVTDMNSIFHNSSFSGCIDDWDVLNVVDMANPFTDCVCNPWWNIENTEERNKIIVERKELKRTIQNPNNNKKLKIKL